MGQFGRIALRFTGNGFNAQFINLSRGGGREHHLIPQPGKEGIPEGIILKHVQNPGYSHLSSGGFILCQRFVGEQHFVFIIKQIRDMVLILLLADAALTAVAGDVLAAS